MKVMLLGCGEMSIAYLKVLRALDIEPLVVGRGTQSAKLFEKATGCRVVLDPLADVLADWTPDAAIVAVSVDALHAACLALLSGGVRRILVEKPAAQTSEQVREIEAMTRVNGASVYVAYNRRFYGSTLLAREIAAEDGGVISAHFDFTEWSHQVAELPLSVEVKCGWFLANSTHVVDLVFHMIGRPRELFATTSGHLDWHPSASAFVGHGVSERGAVFSYHANWAGPGRWMCELITRQNKLIFQPMETLKVMKIGSVAVSEVPALDDLDTKYKPGLFRQVMAFLEGKEQALCRIDEHVQNWNYYKRIGNY